MSEKRCTKLTKEDGNLMPNVDKKKRGMGFHLVCAEIRPRKWGTQIQTPEPVSISMEGPHQVKKAYYGVVH
jgi:hypothetical protein